MGRPISEDGLLITVPHSGTRTCGRLFQTVGLKCWQRHFYDDDFAEYYKQLYRRLGDVLHDIPKVTTMRNPVSVYISHYQRTRDHRTTHRAPMQRLEQIYAHMADWLETYPDTIIINIDRPIEATTWARLAEVFPKGTWGNPESQAYISEWAKIGAVPYKFDTPEIPEFVKDVARGYGYEP